MRLILQIESDGDVGTMAQYIASVAQYLSRTTNVNDIHNAAILDHDGAKIGRWDLTNVQAERIST